MGVHLAFLPAALAVDGSSTGAAASAALPAFLSCLDFFSSLLAALTSGHILTSETGGGALSFFFFFGFVVSVEADSDADLVSPVAEPEAATEPNWSGVEVDGRVPWLGVEACFFLRSQAFTAGGGAGCLGAAGFSSALGRARQLPSSEAFPLTVDSEDVEASPFLATAGRAVPFTELGAEGVALGTEAAEGGETVDCPGADPPQAGLEGVTEAAREVEAEACADGVVLDGRDSFFEGRLRDSSFSSVDALGFSSRSLQLRELLPRFSSVLRSTRGF